ncbi:MAG: Hsp20/alpha crystallin family protein [Ktedonobacterales bacterium]
MQQRTETQRIPLNVWRSDERLTVAAPMPGLEPSDIVVDVTNDGMLMLHGALRGAFKGINDLLMDEWNVGAYERQFSLPVNVNAQLANVTYGNGVLVVALPLADAMTGAHLTLTTTGPAHGERVGSAGESIEPVTTDEHLARQQLARMKHGGGAK